MAEVGDKVLVFTDGCGKYWLEESATPEIDDKGLVINKDNTNFFLAESSLEVGDKCRVFEINDKYFVRGKTCRCTEWIPRECIGKNRRYIRTCTPSACSIEEKFEYDPICTVCDGEKNMDFELGTTECWTVDIGYPIVDAICPGGAWCAGCSAPHTGSYNLCIVNRGKCGAWRSWNYEYVKDRTLSVWSYRPGPGIAGTPRIEFFDKNYNLLSRYDDYGPTKVWRNLLIEIPTCTTSTITLKLGMIPYQALGMTFYDDVSFV